MMRCIQSLVFILHLLCVDGEIKPGDAWGSCEDAHTIARAGDNVTLSCNVSRSDTGASQCKLYEQRTKRTCCKKRVHSCAFYNVTHRESGLYRCNVGLGDLKPYRELGCWQTLVVIEDVQDPYILVTAGDGDSVNLTCCSISVSEPADYNLSVDFTWKRNTTQLVSTTHGVSTWRWIRYHSSTITISGVTGDDEGDSYTCHVVVKGLPSAVWSQEYMLQSTGPEAHANTTTAIEGDRAKFVWTLPEVRSEFSIRTPPGDGMLTVHGAKIYIWTQYKSRLKVVGVTRFQNMSMLKFTLHKVTSADAGKYFCRRANEVIPGSQHFLVVTDPAGTKRSITNISSIKQENIPNAVVVAVSCTAVAVALVVAVVLRRRRRKIRQCRVWHNGRVYLT